MATTNEIVDKIATEHNLTKAQAKAIVESVFTQISADARAGNESNIPGFGKFKVKDTPAREGRNPSTGATIQIAASRKLTFSPAKALKDALKRLIIPATSPSQNKSFPLQCFKSIIGCGVPAARFLLS